jgi:DNA-binding phage protein
MNRAWSTTRRSIAAVAALVSGGASTRDAVAQVAEEFGLRRRELYAAVTARPSG